MEVWSCTASALFNLGSELLADEVESGWCFPDGRNLHVRGDDIVTPNGTGTKDGYTRHTFRYIAPSNDSRAGDEINMRQLNGQTMVLLRPAGTEETWRRCDFQSS